MLPEIGLAKGACTLWKEDLLLDYTIEVEDERFKVHKVVMASVSDYFKAMLTGGMLESKEDKVVLEGLSSLAVKNMIDYVYTGEFGSSTASTEERLACAMYLQIPAAVEICTTSLCDEVNKENCFRMLSIFKSYGIADGIEHTVRFMKHNVEDIFDTCKSKMTLEELQILMDCWGKSEYQLFVLAMQWLKKDPEQRKKHVNEIMSSIRFCLMTPTELAFITSMREMGMITESDNPWYDLVEKALKYHDLPAHQKILDESVQARMRIEPYPVCFGMHQSLTGQLFSLHQGKVWTSYPTVNPQIFYDEDDNTGLTYTCTQINNFYIINTNIGDHAVKCFVFDPRMLTWSAMASTAIPREKGALVYHDKYMYAFGGLDRRNPLSVEPIGTIEKYDFHTNTWRFLNTDMPVPLFRFDAHSIGACIYIPGGHINDDDFLEKTYCFNPEACQWSEKAPPPPEVTSNVVTVDIHGEKVMACIDQGLNLHYYKPSDDMWLMYERTVPTKLTSGEVGNILATGNTIYFVDYECSDVGAFDGNDLPCVSEKWTFGEDGLRIDSKAKMITDHLSSGWTYEHFTHINALLSVMPPSVKRGSVVVP